MFLKKVLILFLTAGAMIAAYFIHNFLLRKINPRKSFGYFILYVVANLATLFGVIILLSLFLYQFRNFFFKP